MKIRFLIANAYAGGGTIRTTITMANTLAERHSVEVVSVVRRRRRPLFEIDPRIRVRSLVDTSSPPAAPWLDPLARPRRLLERLALAAPSLLVHRQDGRHSTFNALTDVRLLRFLRSTRDGVLVSTRPGLNLAVARFARPSVLRVGSEHLHLGRHRKYLRRAIRRHYPRLDALTTLTSADAAAYRALLGPEVRVVALPNAVPDTGGARARGEDKVVIAAGRLTPQKGFDRLISAFARVAAKHPDWQLRIFGRGDQRRRLQERIDDLGLGANVRLEGFTRRLPQEMAGSSIYVLSSRFEGFPMVLLEAMSCGLPVVAFDCPTGPRDLISPGTDGLLVPDGDVDGLAAAVIELIEDDARRKQMGTAAVAKAAQYRTAAIAGRWEQLFAELAAARSVRP